MGFPGNTVDLPAVAPAVRADALAAVLDPEAARDGLLAAASGAPGPPGQVCCSAWVLDPSLAHVLLVRHPLLGWCNPGGHVHVGETVAEAACRELAEETGLVLTPALPAPVLVFERTFPSGPQGGEHRHWLLAHAFVAPLDAPLQPEPGAPVRWFPIAVVPGDCPEIPGFAPLVAGLLAATDLTCAGQ